MASRKPLPRLEKRLLSPVLSGATWSRVHVGASLEGEVRGRQTELEAGNSFRGEWWSLRHRGGEGDLGISTWSNGLA